MKRTLMTLLVACLTLVAAAQNLDYPTGYNRFNKHFKVKGGVGIEQFARALEIYDPEEGEVVMDKKNGYFHVFYEGAGSSTYTLAYWNRKDGKKLVILSYMNIEEDDDAYNKKEYVSQWGYSKLCKLYGTTLRYDIGFMAYLYNTSRKELVPLKNAPITGWKQKKAFRTLELPQKGKNITVKEGHPNDKQTSYTLKWNGTSFSK